jgi:hypothetical protein
MIADRPEDNNNDDTNKDKVVPSFSDNKSNTSNLPIEKLFSHQLFLGQISNIDLATAKQLLADLHLLYLSQQFFVSKIAKQDFLGNIP